MLGSPCHIMCNLMQHVIVCVSYHGDGCEGGVSCLSGQSDGGGKGELEVILLSGEQPLEEGTGRRSNRTSSK